MNDREAEELLVRMDERQRTAAQLLERHMERVARLEARVERCAGLLEWLSEEDYRELRRMVRDEVRASDAARTVGVREWITALGGVAGFIAVFLEARRILMGR